VTVIACYSSQNSSKIPFFGEDSWRNDMEKATVGVALMTVKKILPIGSHIPMTKGRNYKNISTSF